MLVLPEAVCHHALYRPRQAALVGRKFVGKFGVDFRRNRLALGFAGAGTGRLLALLADKVGNLLVQGFNLPVLLLELLLVLLLVFLQLVLHAGAFRFLVP